MPRLLVTTVLPDLPDNAYVRLTDADMMILDPAPFLPPRDPSIAIDIFNGRGAMEEKEKKWRCNEYPMHSVGMRVGLWRELFGSWTPNTTRAVVGPSASDWATFTFADDVVAKLREMFHFDGDGGGHGVTHHGGKYWSMDQLALGCSVDEAMKRGMKVNLAPRPIDSRVQLSISGLPEHRQVRRRSVRGQNLIDAHLADFRLEAHEEWLEKFVRERGVFGYRKDRIDLFTEYLGSWCDEHDSNFAALSKREAPGSFQGQDGLGEDEDKEADDTDSEVEVQEEVV